MKAAVEMFHLSKSYKGLLALNDLSLSIPQGTLFGFIGPDGAGKTTLFRILTSLMLPDSGSVSVLGFDTKTDYLKIRRAIGYMPGKFSLYQDLTVEENLQFFASIHHTTIHENYELIADIYQHIEAFKNRRAGKLSGGMKQKLALSCALIHKPSLLLLDEPTTGVDAVSRTEFWEMLKKLQQQGITILVSTPYMDEAARCSQIALMQQGRFLSVESPDRIIKNFNSHLYSIQSDRMYALFYDLQQLMPAVLAYRFGDCIHFVSTGKQIQTEVLIQKLQAKGHESLVLQPIAPTVEDCFIQLMQEQDSDQPLPQKNGNHGH